LTNIVKIYSKEATSIHGSRNHQGCLQLITYFKEDVFGRFIADTHNPMGELAIEPGGKGKKVIEIVLWKWLQCSNSDSPTPQ